MRILAIPEFEPSCFLKKVTVAQSFSDTIINIMYTIYIWNLFGEGEFICGSFWTHEASRFQNLWVQHKKITSSTRS